MQCSGCKAEHDRQGQRYCHACHAAYMRQWRPKHSELPEAARLRANCRSYTNVLIRRGHLQRGPCAICGATERVHPHHEDYTKPREVRWLCQEHHGPEHDRARIGGFHRSGSP